MDKAKTTNAFLIPPGVFLVIHHFIFWQRLFDVANIMRQEFFETIFFTADIAAWIAKRFSKAGRT